MTGTNIFVQGSEIKIFVLELWSDLMADEKRLGMLFCYLPFHQPEKIISF
jgi:hypothetical protein